MNDGNQLVTKACKICGKEKPIEEFGNTRRDLTNKQYYKHSQCKPCHKNGQKVVARIKKDPSTPQSKSRCYNCGNEFKNKKDTLLDHDYKTEEFRGWLCRRCNAGIGQLGDDIKGLTRAIIYLIKAKLKWYHLFQRK